VPGRVFAEGCPSELAGLQRAMEVPAMARCGEESSLRPPKTSCGLASPIAAPAPSHGSPPPAAFQTVQPARDFFPRNLAILIRGLPRQGAEVRSSGLKFGPSPTGEAASGGCSYPPGPEDPAKKAWSNGVACWTSAADRWK